ncbi:MAG TPA: hypothetical protein PKI93_06580 [Alphaproteobacteria bacterium]|nr:hypothetical protein [Alphaproteobacteria bacterium]
MRLWTEDQKQKQRDAIKRWSPWKNSTGPKTSEGKAISSQNAYKHGVYSVAGKRLKTWLYHQSLYVRQVESLLKDLKHEKNQNPSNELLSVQIKNPPDLCRKSCYTAPTPPYSWPLPTCSLEGNGQDKV